MHIQNMIIFSVSAGTCKSVKKWRKEHFYSPPQLSSLFNLFLKVFNSKKHKLKFISNYNLSLLAIAIYTMAK